MKAISRLLCAGSVSVLLAGCQASQVVVNAPLPTDAAKQPVYSGGFSLPELLKTPTA